MDATSDKGDNEGLGEWNHFMWYELIFTGKESAKEGICDLEDK